MKKKILKFLKRKICVELSVLAVFSACTASAGNLTIADEGVSNYQIVIPDSGKIKQVETYIKEAAIMLQHCIREAAGAELAVVNESNANPAKSKIFLGNTQAAADNGIDVKKLKDWEYIIKISGKNIFIAGADYPGINSKNNFSFFVLGTVKGVAAFLESYLDVRFLMPGLDGMMIPGKRNITVPDDVNMDIKPLFEYCASRHKEMFYDLANNFFPAINYGTYGGHSHAVGIPPGRYFKTNPEYFILKDGKRYLKPEFPNYCISNPQVQELIYQELLSHCDQGYGIVQLGQSDGFTPCQCEKCHDLFEIKPTSKPGSKESYKDPAWGEKLWIIHRSLAERLLKDRPDKKVAVMAYGPTIHPPETFKVFPANVIIEMAHSDAAAFEEWKDIKVSDGYFVYIYNWGQYNTEGYMPKKTPEFIVNQIKCFRKNGVRGIYRCGFGELFGLEGPVYYLYGRLLANPDADADKVLDQYYEYAYGNAMKPMKDFFNLLHLRLKLGLNRTEDWNDTDLLNGTPPANVSGMDANMQIILLRYPESVLNKMESYLNEAGKLVQANTSYAKRLRVSRTEFEYLKLTAGTANKFAQYVKNPTRENFSLVSDSAAERLKFINSLAFSREKEPRAMPLGTIPIFGSDLKQLLIIGGRLSAPLPAPFNWDFDYFKKYNIQPGARSLEISPAAGSADVSQNSQIMPAASPDKSGGITKEAPTSVSCSYDSSNLYITFICAKSELKEVEENRFIATIAPDAARMRQLRFVFQGKARQAAISKLDIKSSANERKVDSYKDFAAGQKTEVSSSVLPGTDTSIVKLAIPWRIFDSAKPSAGQTWYGNFARTRKIPPADYVWQPNLINNAPQAKFDILGKMTFK